MEAFSIQVVLAVIGIILAWMLSTLVSTFKDMKTDVKAMSDSMIAMNLKLEIVMTKHDNTEELAKQNAKDVLDIRARLHTVEGRDAQMLQYIEDNSRN